MLAAGVEPASSLWLGLRETPAMHLEHLFEPNEAPIDVLRPFATRPGLLPLGFKSPKLSSVL